VLSPCCGQMPIIATGRFRHSEDSPLFPLSIRPRELRQVTLHRLPGSESGLTLPTQQVENTNGCLPGRTLCTFNCHVRTD
jgi:hypothetical protein